MKIDDFGCGVLHSLRPIFNKTIKLVPLTVVAVTLLQTVSNYELRVLTEICQKSFHIC